MEQTYKSFYKYTNNHSIPIYVEGDMFAFVEGEHFTFVGESREIQVQTDFRSEFNSISIVSSTVPCTIDSDNVLHISAPTTPLTSIDIVIRTIIDKVYYVGYVDNNGQDQYTYSYANDNEYGEQYLVDTVLTGKLVKNITPVIKGRNGTDITNKFNVTFQVPEEFRGSMYTSGNYAYMRKDLDVYTDVRYLTTVYRPKKSIMTISVSKPSDSDTINIEYVNEQGETVTHSSTAYTTTVIGKTFSGPIRITYRYYYFSPQMKGLNLTVSGQEQQFYPRGSDGYVTIDTEATLDKYNYDDLRIELSTVY